MDTNQGSALEFFDAAMTIELDEKRPSMLYSALPSLVQGRIPALSSIRRALSDFRSSSNSLNFAKNACDGPLPRTPPPGYTSRPASAARSSILDGDNDEDMFREALSDSLLSPLSTPPSFTVSESQTGIKWKYANQGIGLSAQAYAESQSPHLDDTSAILTRQMYIHSLTYLLRGLPATLSTEETISIQTALPPNLAVTARCDHNVSFNSPQRDTSPPSDPSILHRVIATLVFETFVLLQFLIPYVRLFLGHAYRFERKHNVAQRLVNSGIVGAGAVRRTGVQLTQTICQMNDGKLGVALGEVVIWCMRGVTGGLQQGIQEGVVLLGQGEAEGSRAPGRMSNARGSCVKETKI